MTATVRVIPTDVGEVSEWSVFVHWTEGTTGFIRSGRIETTEDGQEYVAYADHEESDGNARSVLVGDYMVTLEDAAKAIGGNLTGQDDMTVMIVPAEDAHND